MLGFITAIPRISFLIKKSLRRTENAMFHSRAPDLLSVAVGDSGKIEVGDIVVAVARSPVHSEAEFGMRTVIPELCLAS